MDPEEFFVEEFTTPVTAVDGIFDNEHLAVSLGIQIDASQPQVALLDASAAKLREVDFPLVNTRIPTWGVWPGSLGASVHTNYCFTVKI